MEYAKVSLFIWICIVSTSLALALESHWSTTGNEHREAMNKFQDCQSHVYASRYQKSCAEIFLNPPRSFWTTWFMRGVEDVNWCGAVSCDVVFSFKGMVLMWSVAIVFRLLFMLLKM